MTNSPDNFSLIKFIKSAVNNNKKLYSFLKYCKCRIKIARGLSYENINLYNGLNGRIIFIHIPKSAGMSIVKALYGKTTSHHARAIDYKNANPAKFDAMFRFAVVRNPYTRLYSAYTYLMSGGMEEIDKVWADMYLRKFRNFNNFVKYGLEKAVKENAEHFIPQHKFVYCANGVNLCHYIGKYEQLDEVEEYLENLGVTVSFNVENKTNREPVSLCEVLTNDCIAEINRIYALDFTAFGYTMANSLEELNKTL